MVNRKIQSELLCLHKPKFRLHMHTVHYQILTSVYGVLVHLRVVSTVV